MLVDDITLPTTGKSVVQIQKTLQFHLYYISTRCNVNHMLSNPVTPKSMVMNYYTTKAPALRHVEIILIRLEY